MDSEKTRAKLKDIAAGMERDARTCLTWHSVKAVNFTSQSMAATYIYHAIRRGWVGEFASIPAAAVSGLNNGRVNWYGIRKLLGLMSLSWLAEFDQLDAPSSKSFDDIHERDDWLMEWHLRQTHAWASIIETFASRIKDPSEDQETKLDSPSATEGDQEATAAKEPASTDPEEIFHDIAQKIDNREGRLARYLATQKLHRLIPSKTVLTEKDPLTGASIFNEGSGTEAVKSAVRMMNGIVEQQWPESAETRIHWATESYGMSLKKKVLPVTLKKLRETLS